MITRPFRKNPSNSSQNAIRVNADQLAPTTCNGPWSERDAMNDMILSKIDAARTALAEASEIKDIKKIADVAEAARIYAKRQKLSEESIGFANALKFDALAKLGEALLSMEKSTGNAGTGNNQHKKERQSPNGTAAPAPTLADVGVSKKESSKAQTVATVKREAPEVFQEMKSGTKTVSQAKQAVQGARKEAGMREKAAEVDDDAPDPSWEIRNGDCVELLKGIGYGTAHLVFADPPYNIGIDYGEGEKADKLDDDAYLAWCEQWIAACVARLSHRGSFWLLIGDEYAAQLAMILQGAGLHRRAWIKWYETFGVNNANNFNRCSRHLLYCVKDPKKFVFNTEAVNRPSDRQAKYNDARANPNGKIWDDVWQIPRLVGNAEERMPGFPTQLPLALLLPILGCSSNPGDLVLDPFCGSGTTGAAAIQLGRRFIGLEKSTKFAELAGLRLACAAKEKMKSAS